ncbi:MAG: YfhO family protein, partial [Chitinophagales bacterium]|nr:YfhO family protein [Chitinophagales bacterium]
LVLVDLWSVDKRYLDASDFKDDKQVDNMFRPTQADRQILQDTDPHYRVFNTTSPSGPFNDALTSYFHKAVGGYHAAKMMRYQDLIERHLSTGNMNVFNMLNTKYFINKDQQGNPIANVNTNALGNAWFVKEHRLVENADEEMNALSNFNPSETAIIDKRFSDYLAGYSHSGNPSNSIKLTSYDSDHMVYQSNASTDQLAVFSEIYYNGKDWKAYIDGEYVPHIRVNYVLRGLKIPAGEHTVEFRFLPQSFYTGRTVSAISFYLLILLVIGSIGLELKKRMLTEEKVQSS